MNVLIVEDNPIFQIKLRNITEKLGYNCTIVDSVASTLLCFQSPQFYNLLICDLVLKDGIVFSIDKWPNIPTLYITAFEESEFMKTALKTNNSWFLTKPFSDLTLEAAIIRLLENVPNPKENSITVFGKFKNPIYLSLNEVLFIESEGNYSTITTIDNTKHVLKRSAKLLIGEHLSQKFIRIKRATFVNKSKLIRVSINENKVFLGNHELSVNKNFKKNIYEFHHLVK